MLAGFAFSSLKMSFPPSTNIIVEIVYLSITACAIGLELCAILNSACCSVFGNFSHLKFSKIFILNVGNIGPGKFLRGAGGLIAAEKAV
jgi:hypothetical protein